MIKSFSKVKSPLNYIGGKYKLLDQILPLFPNEINQFVDLFAGGFNVGINVDANTIYCNDNLTYLIELYSSLKELDFEEIIEHILSNINKFELSLTNEKGYLEFRKHYNQYKYPLDLLILISYSFNHQIRFNNSHEFNNPFGRDRSSFNNTIKSNLKYFHHKIKQKNIVFSSKSFETFNYSLLNEYDFVYLDPPYLITNGTYNDGKRGFKGWTKKEESELIEVMDYLDNNNIYFALSNVIEHKGKTNEILKNWIDQNKSLVITNVKSNYSNSNYQIVNKNNEITKEILVTNYQPNYNSSTLTLF